MLHPLRTFAETLQALFETLALIGTMLTEQGASDGIGKILGMISPDLGALWGFIKIMGKIIMLIIIMLGITVLGLVSLAAAFALKGLNDFGLKAPPALKSFGEGIPTGDSLLIHTPIW